MKLHLPNRLRKVLLNSVVAATVLASGTAYGYTVDIPYGGNCYAGAHTFDFVIGENTTIGGYLLSYTSGGSSNSDAYTWCRYVLEEDASGNIKLVLKRTNGAGAVSGDPYTFGDTITLERGVVYTIKHDGDYNKDNDANHNGATIELYKGDTLIATMEDKNCNMNSNVDNKLVSEFNNTYKVHEYTWKATGEKATMDYTSTNWDNAYGFTTLVNSETQRGDVIFAAGEDLAKTVEVDGTFRLDRVNINDNYTFTAKNGSGVIDANSVTIADGKKVTLGSGTTLGAVHISGYKNMEETVVGSGRLSITNVNSGNHSNGITLGDDFTGILSVSGGKFDLKNLDVGGGTLELAGGEIWTSDLGTYSKNILLNAATLDSSVNFAYGNINLTGAVTGNYMRVSGTANETVSLSNAANEIEGILVTGRTLAISGGKIGYVKATGGTGKIQSGATVEGAIVSDAGTLNISGGKIGYVKATAGTVNLTGTGVTVGQWDTELKFDSTHVAGIYATGGSAVNIGNGTDVSTITATRLEMGDTAWVGTYPNETGSNMASGGTLNVKSNATLVITGADVAAAGNAHNYHSTAIMVGEWGGKSILNIDGKLLAQNASVANGDATGVINVKNGGMLAVKGLKNQRSTSWGAITLNLEEGGTLILGTGGIDTQKFSSKLDAGTIGISAAEVAIAENLVLSNTETGTSFDTTMYKWSDNGATITQDTKGGKLTISGVISDYSVTTGTGDDAVTTTTAGKLVVKGKGELHLTAANTYTGGTEVQSGKLVAATGQALGSNGSITISGGSLEVTSDKVTITKSGAENATITCVTDGENQQNKTGVYSLGSDGSQVNDARVEVVNNSAETVTVSNRLVNVELVNNGTATIEAGNGYNDFTAISALKGDITLEGLGNKANNGNVDTVSSLTIGAGRKLTAYQAWDEGAKATVKVEANGTATFGAEAQMAANLELGSGTELTLAGALNMGNSTLTLGQSLTLDETTLNSILNMSGDRLDLFTNVSSLILGTDPYAMGTDILDDTTNVALGTWFTLPDSEVAMLSNTTTPTAGSFYLGYDANGTVYAGKVVPEPTTATLSLLALAGLAARRRRK